MKACKHYLFLILMLFIGQPTHAIEMVDWVFNVDGDITEDFAGDLMPTTGALVDGLGILSLEVSGEGAHSVFGFFDFEIDQAINTFFNESGSNTGSAAFGQSWEIDEPGYVFGDIVDNVVAGALDNTNEVPAGAEDDVSFAFGWDFGLLVGEIATIDYVFTDILPTVDFFITQLDPDSNRSLYAYSLLNIEGNVNEPPITVDEPSSMILLLVLGALLLSFRRKTIR